MMDEGWSAATRMLVTHLLSIGGVVLASQRTLATYLAVSSLPPPVFPPPSEETVAPNALSATRRVLAKPWVRNTVKVATGVIVALVMYAILMGGIVALFRFATQVILDVVFGSFVGVFLAFSFFTTFAIALEAPTLVFYQPQHPKTTEKDKQKLFTLQRKPAPHATSAWYQRPRNLLIGAAVSCFALLGSVSAGVDLPLVLIPLVWTVPVVSAFHSQHMSMRRVVQILFGYVAMMLTVAAIMIPIALHFKAKQDDKTPEELEQEAKDAAEEDAKWTMPSIWVMKLVDMFHYVYVVGIPGIFIAHTWRFDYTSQHSSHLGSRPALAADSQETALIPSMSSLPSFYPTTASYAIGSMAVTIFGLTGLFIVNRDLGEIFSGTGGLVAIIPIMTLSTAFGAWRHGLLSDWWIYSETWVPQADEMADLEAVTTELPSAGKQQQ